MEIRQYNKKDVIQLWIETGLTVPWNDPENDIMRKVNEDPEGFYVAEYENKIIGTARVGYDGHRGNVYYFCIRPEYQRSGYGSTFIKKIEDILFSKGCPKMNILVRNSNIKAKYFYKTVGYKQDEIICLGKRLIPD